MPEAAVATDPNDDAIRDLDVIQREPRRQRGVSDLAHRFHHGVSPQPDSSTATRATESVQACGIARPL